MFVRPHQETRDIPIESIHEFLILQAAMRRVTQLNQHRLNNLANAGTVVPTDESRLLASQHAHNTSLLVASLPSIVYEASASVASRPASARRNYNIDNDDNDELGGQRTLWSRQSLSSSDIESQLQPRRSPSQAQLADDAEAAASRPTSATRLNRASNNNNNNDITNSSDATMDKDTMCMVSKCLGVWKLTGIVLGKLFHHITSYRYIRLTTFPIAMVSFSLIY